jgi:hypothetical protein
LIYWEDNGRVMRNVGIKYLIIALLAVVLAGCASGSAPLVDLPAPISGHINISNPDSDGNVLVAGSAGAVDGGSMVMVVNETTAGISAVMILDLLVKPAYAQSSAFPSICNTTGRACGVAGADGSFTVTLPAAIGDSLAIGVIDSSGRWISEILRRDVSTTETETCADEGVSGAVVDIKTLFTETSGVVYAMLKQGSDETPNQLVIGSSTTEGEVFDIEGCHAHSLDVQLVSPGEVAKLVVTSQDDKIVWFGTFDGSDIVDGKYFTLETEPMSVNYASSENGPVVALKGTTSVTLAEISETDGSIVQSMDVTNGNSSIVEGLTRSSHLSLMEMADGQFFGMLITDKGDTANSYLTFFLLDGLHEYDTMGNSVDALSNLKTMPDGSFWNRKISGTSEEEINLVLIGWTGTDYIAMTFGIYVKLSPNLASVQLTKETEIDTQTAINAIENSGESPPQSFELKNIAVSVMPDNQQDADIIEGVITTSEGKLFTVNLEQPTDLWGLIALPSVAANSDLVAISILNAAEAAYVADATAGRAVIAEGVFAY